MKILKRLLQAGALLCVLNPAHASFAAAPSSSTSGNNGINLGEAGVGVYFDINADGVRDHIQWVRRGGDEGFLALDRSGNGLIDDGAELFGVGTPMILEGRNAPNGFVGLAQYDARQLGGNDDGLITEADAIWPQLRIWVDLDADGVATYARDAHAEELRHHRARNHSEDSQVRRCGGQSHPLWAWAMQRVRPGRALMVDVFFRKLSR